MAKGLVEGIVGGEEEKPEVETPEALAGAAAFASAIAAIASKQDPEVARRTAAFLTDQSELLKVQKEHLKDEHALRLTQLRRQAALLRGQQIGQAVRVTIQVVTALIFIAIGVSAVAMVHDAFNSRGVVIEPFEISPNVAEQVPTGRIVASGLLDHITELQATARLLKTQKSDLAGAWAEEASITIPEAGLSLNQVEQFLRQKLGHDIHVSGDIVRAAPDGIALTIRGLDVLPKTFAGSSGDLDSLLQQAAEYLYGEANIVAFSYYLDTKKQYRREIEYLQSHIKKASEADRASVLVSWAGALVDSEGMSRLPQAKSLMQQAIKIAPRDPLGYRNLGADMALGGDEEGAAGLMETALRAGIEPADLYTYADLHYDFQSEKKFSEKNIEDSQGTGTLTGGQPQFYLAIVSARQHDMETAENFLNSMPIDAQSEDDVAEYAGATAMIAADKGNLTDATKAWDQLLKITDPRVWIDNGTLGLYPLMCFAAVDYEKAGMPQKADAALDAPKRILGVDSYVDCYRSRGDVLDLRGDWKGAQEWYGKAIKLAPSIPSGYYSYGLALMKHGDIKRAEEQLKLASEKGPHWADPLKAWGDVLVKQGNKKDALAKYDEALKYAPSWKHLHEARDAVAKQSR
jgi:tetratricopeptide (TPR) repeat protein